MEGICPVLDTYRRDGAISIPAGDLAAAGVAHVHSASWPWIATHNDLSKELPNVSMIVWEGKNTLHMLSPHQTILYLDREVMPNVPRRFYITLDSELDKIVPGYPIYCPKPEDGLFLVEVTSVKQRPMPLMNYSLEHYSRSFWASAQESKDYWRIFSEDIIDSLNRTLIPGRPYMEDEDIMQAKQYIRNALLAAFPEPSPQKARVALKIVQAVEAHPEAKRMTALIDETSADLLRKIA